MASHKDRLQSICSLGAQKFTSKYFLRLALFLFLLFNLVVYGKVASKQAIGRPNVIAKLCMSGAVTLNTIYIFPLSKILGYQNIIVKPFYLARNVIYQSGLYFLDNNDAEREMLWYIVRYNEFEELIVPQIDRYIDDKPSINPAFLVEWIDEVYQHIKTIPLNSFKDEWFNSRRFNIFCDIVWNYVALRPALLSQLAGENENLHPFLKDKKEISRIEDVLRDFMDFRGRARAQEPEGLKYFYSLPERWYGDLEIIHTATLYILVHRDITGTLTCADPLLGLHLETRNKLLHYVVNDSRLTPEKKQEIENDLNSSLDSGLVKAIASKCPEEFERHERIDIRLHNNQ